jgi:hypothetical protein
MSSSQDDFSGAFGVMPDALGSPATGATGASASANIGGPGSSEPPMPPPLSGTAPPRPAQSLRSSDFLAYPAKHKIIYRPTREIWTVEGLNMCFPAVRKISFAKILARTGKRIDSITAHPSEGEFIYDKVAVNNGWLPQPGARTFNTYIPPLAFGGYPFKASPWVDHWKALYPQDHDLIIKWLAHRRRFPGIKPNYCIVLGGPPGIGKDTLLCPMRDAVGPWNCDEIQLHNMGSQFNGYQGGVILRISEARDIGDGTLRGRIDRYALNDRMKPLLASPPETFRCNRKWEPEYYAFNICGVIITTNHPDALYITVDDRRYYVVMSARVASEFSKEFFTKFYHWYYEEGGIGHVIAYLDALDLSNFNPHAAPPKTDAFWAMANADCGQEDSELEDALDALGTPDPSDPEKIIRPDAVTIAQLAAKVPGADWLADAGKGGKSRVISRRLRESGYVNIRNPDALSKRGLWKLKVSEDRFKYSGIFVRQELTPKAQLRAARQLRFKINGPAVVQGGQSQSQAQSQS